MSQQLFLKKDAIRFGWEKVTASLLFFVGLTLITFLISAFFDYIVKLTESAGILSSLVVFVSWVVDMAVTMGVIHIMLMTYGGTKAGYADLLKPLDRIVNYFIATVIYIVVVTVGFILLVVPGVILAIKYGFYGYAIVDKDLNPIDALKKSGEITRGAKWDLFLLAVILAVFNIVGALLFGLGLFITVPLSFLASTYAYKTLFAGQKESGEESTPEASTQQQTAETPEVNAGGESTSASTTIQKAPTTEPEQETPKENPTL